MCTCVYFQTLCILAPAAATFHSDILHPFNICVFMWTSWLRSLRIPTLWHNLISFSSFNRDTGAQVFFRCKLLYKLLLNCNSSLFFFFLESRTRNEIKYHICSQQSAIFTALVFSAYSPFIIELIQAGTSPRRLSLPVGGKPLESSLACFIYLYHVCQSECQGGRLPGGLFPP